MWNKRSRRRRRKRETKTCCWLFLLTEGEWEGNRGLTVYRVGVEGVGACDIYPYPEVFDCSLRVVADAGTAHRRGGVMYCLHREGGKGGG